MASNPFAIGRLLGRRFRCLHTAVFAPWTVRSVTFPSPFRSGQVAPDAMLYSLETRDIAMDCWQPFDI